MGYESRLYIVRKCSFPLKDGSEYKFAERIATINMCKMGWDFSQIFKREIDYKITDEEYDGEEEYEFDTDKYGEHLRAASLPEVRRWLMDHPQQVDGYWRIWPLLGLLSGIDQALDGNTESLEVVHYGY